jgi:hypothetical protein
MSAQPARTLADLDGDVLAHCAGYLGARRRQPRHGLPAPARRRLQRCGLVPPLQVATLPLRLF